MEQPAGSAAVSFEDARAVLEAQPFSRLLGTKLTAFRAGHAELRLVVRPELLQQGHFVHGGVLAYAADNAITFAGGSILGAAVLTKGLVIEYVRPAQGDFLRAAAHVVTRSGRHAVCRAEIYAVTGNNDMLCAVAQGTVSAVRPAP
jgi:uncharacterized protein (TIGR00369 family)